MFKRTQPIVILEHYTPLKMIDKAIGRCWDKQRPEDVVDTKRMYRVGNKNKHQSVLEHVYYNFTFKNISRGLLQEIARTRIASPSVKSSRYTLIELKTVSPFILDFEFTPNDGMSINIDSDGYNAVKPYMYFTGNKQVDDASIVEMEILRRQVKTGIDNDYSKYNIPDAYLTEMSFTINMRALQHLLLLRTATSALEEYRILAKAIFNVIPDDHKFMLKEFVYNEDDYESVNEIIISRIYLDRSTNTKVIVIDVLHAGTGETIVIFKEINNGVIEEDARKMLMDTITFKKIYKLLKKDVV